MNYNPGLHILAEIETVEIQLLVRFEEIKKVLNQLVKSLELQKVGEVFHDFEGGGYTGVLCLTESHIALHSWPEFGKLTVDVYLSNCKKTNDEKVRIIFDRLVEFLKSDNFNKREIFR